MTRTGRQLRVVAAVATLLLGGCHGAAPPAESVAVHPFESPTMTAAVPTTVAPSAAPVTTAAASAPPATPARPGPAATNAAPVRTAPPTTARAPTPVTTPPCPVNLAAQLASTKGASQLVTVDAPSEAATTATVMLWQRSGPCWAPAGGPWPARVGRNGLSAHHREGDATTPTGGYAIGPAFYGIASDPGVHGSYHQLTCGDWWDEDPASPRYNSFQHVACGTTPPFAGGSEALWTETTASNRLAVVEYNTTNVVPGAGSAIFIHNDIGGPTNGCVSLAPDRVDTLLRWLQPAQSPHVIIGSDAEIRQF